MHAIFGIWHLDGTQVERATLNRMAESLKIAPEKQRTISLHCDGAIGMGRVTIDRTVGEQPPTQEGHLLCLADARLYCVPEMATPLDLSPSERERLICRLHSRAGDDAPNQFDGDFAYALWDNTAQRLSLVRDHAGVRPLFYANGPGRSIVWASHSDMIVRSGLIVNDFDLDAAIGSYFYETSDQEKTLVRGLKRLPAAHVLHVDASGREAKTRYWELNCVDPITDIFRFEECASELRRLLDTAVRRRLSKRDSFGAHLSGGLDSTSISVLAARALSRDKRPLHTYSFVAEMRDDVQFIDERPYVDATVQSEPNIYSSKITPSDQDQGNIDLLTDRMGGYDAEEEKILQAADNDAVNVILSGWGGDEVVTFNGRGAYAEHFVRGRWRALWRELKARSKVLGKSKKQIFTGEVLPYILPEGIANAMRRAAGKEAVITEDDKLIQFLSQSFKKSKGGGIYLGASAYGNRLKLFNNGHIAHRLENWALQGTPHGIQYSFPLLDRDLLEFAIRLPASFFLRNGIGRTIFREAMKDVLPESVRTRRLKFAPFPCSLLRLAERKTEYLRDLVVLRQDKQLSKILDFEVIEAALRELPDPEEVKSAFNAEAAGGTSPSLAPTLVEDPIAFARFLKGRFGS